MGSSSKLKVISDRIILLPMKERRLFCSPRQSMALIKEPNSTKESMVVFLPKTEFGLKDANFYGIAGISGNNIQWDREGRI